MRSLVRRHSAVSAIVVAAACLAAAGCATTAGHAGAPGCSKSAPGTIRASSSLTSASAGSPAGSSSGSAAAGWTLPGADLQNTRNVASEINSSNVSTLGVAWTAPIKDSAPGLDYATTAVVVNGVLYTQDLRSNVTAIKLATGKILWTHVYNSPNGGPDGVNVAGGIVYAATNHAAVALRATTGRQLWSQTLIANDHEGIDMAPGYNNGTVYVSTVPVNPAVGEYLGGGKGTLWALSARTGAREWSFDTVQNLWGNPAVNSGGGLWEPPSFDSHGNIYIGIANPGPVAQDGWPHGYPWGTSRPGPDLYTDSVVKLSRQGKLLWYYQLTPHDIYDWDLQNSPVLTTANGQRVVIDGGKAGILIELSAQTGKLLWRLPVGVHNGHEDDGLRAEYARPTSHLAMPARFCLEPGSFAGIMSQLATNGTTTFAAVNDLGVPISERGVAESAKAYFEAVKKATGEMIAVNQDTGRIEWDDELPSSPYGGAAVTNNVVFTTTYSGYLYAFNATTGAVLLKARFPGGTNAAVTIDGDYVIAGTGVVLSAGQRPLIIAYKLGGRGKLPGSPR